MMDTTHLKLIYHGPGFNINQKLKKRSGKKVALIILKLVYFRSLWYQTFDQADE